MKKSMVKEKTEGRGNFEYRISKSETNSNYQNMKFKTKISHEWTRINTKFVLATEGRRQRTEDRGQKTEDRRQKTEDRRQKTEDRRQRTEDRRERVKRSKFSIDNRLVMIDN